MGASMGMLSLWIQHRPCRPHPGALPATHNPLMYSTACRKWNTYRRALPGFNAASVGLILASVFKMTLDVYNLSPFPTADLCIGLFAFAAVDELGIFEPIVVVGGILLGLLAWGAKMN